MAKGFHNTTYVAPLNEVDADTSGGHAGDGGLALGGHGGNASGGDGTGVGVGGNGGDASQSGLLNLNLLSDVEGGDAGDGVGVGAGGNGGSADGGNARADGGDGGNGGDVYTDQSTTVNQDYRFEDSFNEDNDTTTNIRDSFNEDNDTTYIRDSFKSDDDGVDNKGGHIEDSVVAGRDIDDSFNSDDDVEIDDSFNTDYREYNIDASDDHVNYTEIKDSFNSDDDVLDLDVLNGLDIL
ncbi:MAG: hypothetical protein ACRDRR_12305 [Pseudonocardiaceae bacterium]